MIRTARPSLAEVPLADLSFDVGLAASVIKALIGDVVIKSRVVEGQAKPQMFARFTLNALPALGAIATGSSSHGNDSASSLWSDLREEVEHAGGCAMASRGEIVVPLKRPSKRDDVQQDIGHGDKA